MKQTLGPFKLKDKQGRNSFRINFDKTKLTTLEYIDVVKLPNETNKVVVFVEWNAPEIPEQMKHLQPIKRMTSEEQKTWEETRSKK